MTQYITNPVLHGFNPDPSLLRVGTDYYLATSTFQWFPGVSIYHSTNLINWENVCRPLNNTKLLDLQGVPDSGGVWAPDLSYHDGKFWLVYSNVKSLRAAFKDTPNFLTTASSIDGPWSDPVFLNANGFDASMFHDQDGHHYLVNMVWDYRSYKHSFFGIQLREYSPKEKQLIGPAHLIWKGTKDGLVEGPHLYHIGDYYYLFCAEGGTHWAHEEVVARSKSLLGPYEMQPDGPILSDLDAARNPLQKSGHASLIDTPDHKEWYIAHLTARPQHHPTDSAIDPRGWCSLGRETAIQKIEWDDQHWPHVVNGMQGSVKVAAPQSGTPALPIASNSERVNFQHGETSKNFQTLRTPLNTFAEIENGKGLVMEGRCAPSSLFDVSFLARRWQSYHFVSTTKLAFNPHTFQQLAGMLNFYDSKDYTGIYVSYDEDRKKRILEIISCDAENYSFPLGSAGRVTLPGNADVYLRTTQDGVQYHYSYSLDGQNWHDLGPNFDSLKLSDDYIFDHYGPHAYFTGAFTGMFASDLTGSKLPATFAFFDYQEK